MLQQAIESMQTFDSDALSELKDLIRREADHDDESIRIAPHVNTWDYKAKRV